MVNTLFAGKVMFVNQAIIILRLCCLRLAGGGVEWLGKFFWISIYITDGSFLHINLTIDFF